MKRIISAILLFTLLFTVGFADIQSRNLKVEIKMMNEFPIWEGDDIVLVSILTGDWSDLTYTFQWQYSKDGIEYYDIPHATESCYIFKATRETLRLYYRVAINIPDELLQ